MTESLLDRALRSGSPWSLLRSAFRRASLSVAGAIAFLGLLAAYAIAVSFLAAALLKPLAPDTVGVWLEAPDSVSLQVGIAGTPRGRELLGWWIVPLGLAAGAGGVWLTTRIGRFCLTRLRRSPPVARRDTTARP